MDNCDYMEVDDNELPPSLRQKPNLPCLLKPSSELQFAPAPDPQAPSPSSLKQEPLLHLLPLPQPQLVPSTRRQQTNVPRCLDEVALPTSDPDPVFADNGACAPSLQGFDFLDAPFLPIEDVDRVLSDLQDSAYDSFAPSVPEVPDSLAIQIQLIPPGQLPPFTATRVRRDTITLVPDSESEACFFDAEDDRQLIGELMDDEEDTGGDQCGQAQMPATCHATSGEHRQYDEAARYILELHQAFAQDVPHAKKKPMLHEFLGYVLFQGDTQLSVLHGSVYFCQENGDRLVPQRPREHFRVANFQAVSEVWKIIKCNSSKDCTKNMKRAMRMSTTNDRNYFVNLTQRQHRMQIFKFGERSMEYFRRAFRS